MRSVLALVVRIPVALVSIVVVLAIWVIAAPAAFVLAGWAAIRGTQEEKFSWGEALLQRARGLSESVAQLAWKIV